MWILAVIGFNENLQQQTLMSPDRVRGIRLPVAVSDLRLPVVIPHPTYSYLLCHITSGCSIPASFAV